MQIFRACQVGRGGSLCYIEIIKKFSFDGLEQFCATMEERASGEIPLCSLPSNCSIVERVISRSPGGDLCNFLDFLANTIQITRQGMRLGCLEDNCKTHAHGMGCSSASPLQITLSCCSCDAELEAYVLLYHIQIQLFLEGLQICHKILKNTADG